MTIVWLKVDGNICLDQIGFSALFTLVFSLKPSKDSEDYTEALPVNLTLSSRDNQASLRAFICVTGACCR